MSGPTNREEQLAIIAKEFHTALQEAKTCPYMIDASCPAHGELRRVLERGVDTVSPARLSSIVKKVETFLGGSSRECRVLFLLQDAMRRKEMYGL